MPSFEARHDVGVKTEELLIQSRQQEVLGVVTTKRSMWTRENSKESYQF